jgi:hypothetical protein
LDAAVAKALERDVDRRYVTAEDMRKALKAPECTHGRRVGTEELSETMMSLFAEPRERKRRFIAQHMRSSFGTRGAQPHGRSGKVVGPRAVVQLTPKRPDVAPDSETLQNRKSRLLSTGSAVLRPLSEVSASVDVPVHASDEPPTSSGERPSRVPTLVNQKAVASPYGTSESQAFGDGATVLIKTKKKAPRSALRWTLDAAVLVALVALFSGPGGRQWAGGYLREGGLRVQQGARVVGGGIAHAWHRVNGGP